MAYFPVTFPALEDFPRGSVHRALEFAMERKLEFLYYPSEAVKQHYVQMRQTQRTPPGSPAVPIFVGQVPNGMTPECIAWAVDAIMGRNVVCWAVSGRKSGCAKVYVERQEDAEELLTLSGSVMFDLCGIWMCSDNAELRSAQMMFIAQQTLRIKSGIVRTDPRLPKGPIVLELVGFPFTKPVPTMLPVMRPATTIVLDERRPAIPPPAIPLVDERVAVAVHA